MTKKFGERVKVLSEHVLSDKALAMSRTHATGHEVAKPSPGSEEWQGLPLVHVQTLIVCHHSFFQSSSTDTLPTD